MSDHVFLNRSGQVRQANEAVAKVYRALRHTREGGHSCVSIGATAKLIKCPLGVQCLHTLKVYPKSIVCGGLGRAFY